METFIRSRFIALFAMLLFVLLAPSVWAKKLSRDMIVQAKVCEVGDGDSVHLCFGAEKTKARLLGIDAPEYKEGKPKASQTYGKEARDALAKLVLGKMVKAHVVDLDQYDRPLVVILLGDEQINYKMVCDGHAYAYTGKGAPSDPKYRSCESGAREAKRGFWAWSEDRRPEYPGKWKRKHRE